MSRREREGTRIYLGIALARTYSGEGESAKPVRTLGSWQIPSNRYPIVGTGLFADL